jgi:hypothetical protein
VLAHHVIFHWNRIGLPYTTQRTLANMASCSPVGRSGSGGVGGAKLVVQRADGGGTTGWGKCGEVVFEAAQDQLAAAGAHGGQSVQGNLCGGYHPVQITGRDVGPG